MVKMGHLGEGFWKYVVGKIKLWNIVKMHINISKLHSSKTSLATERMRVEEQA